MLTNRDRVITTTDDAVQAETLEMSLRSAVVEMGVQDTWSVRVEPIQVGAGHHSMYAVCVGRL